MDTGKGIVIAGAVVAVGIILHSVLPPMLADMLETRQYELIPDSSGQRAWRLNTETGRLWFCIYNNVTTNFCRRVSPLESNASAGLTD